MAAWPQSNGLCTAVNAVEKQQLTKQLIMEAVGAHMYGVDGDIRFDVGRDPQGFVFIRVLPGRWRLATPEAGTPHKRMPMALQAMRAQRANADGHAGNGVAGQRRRSSGNQRNAENVQRWIGYVLHEGHRDMSLNVSEGWVDLAELAVAMRISRPRKSVIPHDPRPHP